MNAIFYQSKVFTCAGVALAAVLTVQEDDRGWQNLMSKLRPISVTTPIGVGNELYAASISSDGKWLLAAGGETQAGRDAYRPVVTELTTGAGFSTGLHAVVLRNGTVAFNNRYQQASDHSLPYADYSNTGPWRACFLGVNDDHTAWVVGGGWASKAVGRIHLANEDRCADWHIQIDPSIFNQMSEIFAVWSDEASCGFAFQRRGSRTTKVFRVDVDSRHSAVKMKFVASFPRSSGEYQLSVRDFDEQTGGILICGSVGHDPIDHKNRWFWYRGRLRELPPPPGRRYPYYNLSLVGRHICFSGRPAIFDHESRSWIGTGRWIPVLANRHGTAYLVRDGFSRHFKLVRTEQ